MSSLVWTLTITLNIWGAYTADVHKAILCLCVFLVNQVLRRIKIAVKNLSRKWR